MLPLYRVKRNYGYKSHTKKKVPCREEKLENVAICRSKLLYKKLYTIKSCLIIDDKTYCAAYFRSLPGHLYYSAINCKKLNSKYKWIGMQKIAKKLLVWREICEWGERSSCFVTTGKINTKIYIKECLKNSLLPFLTSHPGNLLLWPNLASCQYSGTTLN